MSEIGGLTVPGTYSPGMKSPCTVLYACNVHAYFSYT